MVRAKRSKAEDDEEAEEEEEEEEERKPRTRAKRAQRASPAPAAASAAAAFIDNNNNDDDDDDDGSSLSANSAHLPYSAQHRELLQFFMLVKLVDEEELVREHAPKLLLQSSTTLATLERMIADINAKLAKDELCLEIKPRSMSEFPGQRKTWGLVNTRVDEVSKRSTPLEPWELALFQAALKLLATSEHGLFHVNDALKHMYSDTAGTAAQAQAGKKTTADAHRCFGKLVRLKWLSATSDAQNYYSVGQRSLLELGPHLAQLGAKECPITKQVVIATEAYQEWLASMPGRRSNSS